jgi:hypothetical protein
MKTIEPRAEVEPAAPAPRVPQVPAPRDPGAGRRIGATAKAGFLSMLEQASNWRDLRRTPYGLGPVLILSGVGLFQAIESQAFGIASPDIARDLDINLRGIIGIRQMVGVITIFVGLYVAWWFDRRTRAKWVGIGTIVSGLSGVAQSQAVNFGTVAAPRVADEVSELGSGSPGRSADWWRPSPPASPSSSWAGASRGSPSPCP